MAATHFSILVLCTGNVCRSPAAERLLRMSLAPGSEVEVESAGAAALTGRPIEPLMAELLRDEGADVDRFVARGMTAEMLEGADLVLGATRWHRAAAVQLHPPSVRRAFTLREFARLCHSASQSVTAAAPNADPGARLAALVDMAPTFRAREPVRKPDEDDIIDPFGAGRRIFVRAFAQLRPAVDEIVRAAWLSAPGSPERQPAPPARR